MNDDRLVLVDIETTGLEVSTELILEVGVRLIEVESWTTIDEFDVQVWESPVWDKRLDTMLRDPAQEYVLKMHQGNGLWDACRAEGMTLTDAEEAVRDFLSGHGPGGGDPMVGSSIAFDRGFLSEQMPSVNDWFHYRNIDVSSLKELCRRLNPDLYARLDDMTEKQNKHRVLDDIEDTQGELRWYIDNFLWIP